MDRSPPHSLASKVGTQRGLSGITTHEAGGPTSAKGQGDVMRFEKRDKKRGMVLGGKREIGKERGRGWR